MTRIADNPVVRAVGRIPASVQRKLLAAFAIVVVLLIAVGAVGIGVLSQANNRVLSLRSLPQRVATYGELEENSVQLTGELLYRQALITPCAAGEIAAHDECALEVGNCFYYHPGCGSLHVRPDAALVAEADNSIETTLYQLSLLSNVPALGFVPPTAERSLLSAINANCAQLSAEVGQLATNDSASNYGPNLSESNDADAVIEVKADQLVNNAKSNAATLSVENQTAYLDSQRLFVGVAAASVVLALLLGVVLSLSLVQPIKRMRVRLRAITVGDFSSHVEVTNRDELGALASDLNVMNDELGRLYGELEKASKHKSEFLANMSHELRTPLNAVIGFSEVLEGRLFGELNEKQAEYVGDIHSSGRHLLTLINDILDLSKIEAGRMDLQVTSFLFSDVVQNSVALLRERATRQGIALGYEFDDNADVVEADERMIKQVIFNLLTNALKFTPRGGHVDVSVHGDGGDVVVSVRDDGVGIAPADQARIFEEFQQVGTSQLQEGTGLGLAISRRFVELHGGRLWVESQSGHGSTFSFGVPRIQDSAAGSVSDASVRPDVIGAATPTAVPLQ